MTPTRILVVEDDAASVTALREKLTLEGYEVRCAADGEAAQHSLRQELPDLVLLDLMLPKLDGLSVLRWLRKRQSAVPVLVLSAKGQEEEKVEGLRAGADDYLAKPFGLKELLARIEALLRRARGPQEPFRFGRVLVDFRRRTAFLNGREVVLSRKEYDLLEFLIRHRRRVVSREEILDSVWGYMACNTARAVDFHILNLRRKLEADPRDPQHILTRHGFGYQFAR